MSDKIEPLELAAYNRHELIQKIREIEAERAEFASMYFRIREEQVVDHGLYRQAIEVLKFYADDSTYDIEHLNKHGYIIIDKDGGERARDFLSSLGEKE